MNQKEFSIPFIGLKPGEHQFTYAIDNTFFDSFDYHEFNNVELEATLLLNKLPNIMEVVLMAKGIVNVNCDLTNEAYDQNLDTALKLVIKFGDAFNDEDDEILILPHGEHAFDISQYLYEMIVLGMPSKRVHPGVLDGSLESRVLDKLNELRPKKENKNNEGNDPRWNALKKLLADK